MSHGADDDRRVGQVTRALRGESSEAFFRGLERIRIGFIAVLFGAFLGLGLAALPLSASQGDTLLVIASLSMVAVVLLGLTWSEWNVRRQRRGGIAPNPAILVGLAAMLPSL